MKKYIFVLNAINVMAKLLKEKRVEGVLFLDENTGRLTFKAYNWGKEAIERIKVYGSFPKDYGTATVMGLLDEHAKDAKNALIDRELDIIEFC